MDFLASLVAYLSTMKFLRHCSIDHHGRSQDDLTSHAGVAASAGSAKRDQTDDMVLSFPQVDNDNTPPTGSKP